MESEIKVKNNKRIWSLVAFVLSAALVLGGAVYFIMAVARPAGP